jgi:peptidyl-prolyl cis-trans isomerase SurA
VQPVGRSKVQQIRDYVANNDDADEVLAQFNTDERVLITFEEKTIERQPEEEGTWRVGDISGIEVNRDGVAQFYKILEVLPPRTKTLQEARGYIIADYQDYLENRWVEELREEYDVEVNQKVFKSLIKI